jgi:hypothetical protein
MTRIIGGTPTKSCAALGTTCANVHQKAALEHLINTRFHGILIRTKFQCASRACASREAPEASDLQQRYDATRWNREIVVLQLGHVGDGEAPAVAQKIRNRFRSKGSAQI